MACTLVMDLKATVEGDGPGEAESLFFTEVVETPGLKEGFEPPIGTTINDKPAGSLQCFSYIPGGGSTFRLRSFLAEEARGSSEVPELAEGWVPKLSSSLSSP
ncbi:hypothetical protein YC2023_111199 [Brassica napus]